MSLHERIGHFTETESVVSKEGFSSLFTDVLDILRQRPEVKDGVVCRTEDERKLIDLLRKSIQRQYNNPAWVKSRTLTTEEVASDDFSESLEVDGRACQSLDDVQSGMRALLGELKAYNRVLVSYQRKIDAWDNQIKTCREELIYDVMRKVRAEFDDTPTPLDEFKSTKVVFGNRQLVRKEDDSALSVVVTKEPTGTPTLPPLGENDLKKVSDMMLELLDAPTLELVTAIGVPTDDGHPKRDVYIEEYSEVEDFYRQIATRRMAERYIHPALDLVDAAALLSAMERWADRSFK